MQMLEDRLSETVLRMFHERIGLWSQLRLCLLRELSRQLAQNPLRTADGKLQKTRDFLRSETLRSLEEM